MGRRRGKKWNAFTAAKHTRVGDDYQVDPANMPPIPEVDGTAAPGVMDAPDEYEASWIPRAAPGGEKNVSDWDDRVEGYLKQHSSILGVDQLLIALHTCQYDVARATELVLMELASMGGLKRGVDGASLEPWADWESEQYAAFMKENLKHFGNVQKKLPHRSLGEVMFKYYSSWKKNSADVKQPTASAAGLPLETTATESNGGPTPDVASLVAAGPPTSDNSYTAQYLDLKMAIRQDKIEKELAEVENQKYG